MADDRPCVTVVIPTYNGSALLPETLTSVQRQTLSDVEVLVVDDGSDDDSIRVVREHEIEARVLEQDHLGVAVARNRGLAEARGRWVCFLDQDDLWHPERLARLVAWLEAHPDERLVATTESEFSTIEDIATLTAQDPMVGSWAANRVPQDSTLTTLCETVDVTGTDLIEHYDAGAMLRGPITATTSFIADPELLRLAGGFAPHGLALDDYWLLVNASRIVPIAKIDQPTAFYRIHARATSRTTRLALPFLASAVALRLGGGIVGADQGLAPGTTGPLHAHLLRELRQSPDFADPRVAAAARHLGALLFDEGKTQHWKAVTRMRAPWLVPAARHLRGVVTPRRRPHGAA